jgi:response regulator RpfG family c-di-GMP phosphodiesterase
MNVTDNKTKILYVDDEPINLILFEINFRKKYNVLSANNALEGLELLNTQREIKVIISDMKMPEINGIEFIKRAKILFPEKKFYILTGFEITAEIKQAIDSGLILKYFCKPLNIKEIDESISSAPEIVN